MTKAKKQDSDVAMDRRTNDRRGQDRRQNDTPVQEDRRKLERRVKVNRRRQIDPTTCERDYSDDEIEFMQALDAYKRKNGRMFPTCSEVLEVIRDLGYAKLPASTPDEIAAQDADQDEFDTQLAADDESLDPEADQ